MKKKHWVDEQNDNNYKTIIITIIYASIDDKFWISLELENKKKTNMQNKVFITIHCLL